MKPIRDCAQMVMDIILGFRTPADNNSRIEFYRRSNPSDVLLSIPLNHRATFRWVPPPDLEIHLDKGDRLEWRVADTVIGRLQPDDLDWFNDLDVWVMGKDEDGEAIVQQSRWLNAGRVADSPIRALLPRDVH